MQLVRVLLVFIVMGISSGLNADLYQWTDKKGHRVYSDTKPTDGTPYTVRSQQSLPPLLTTQSTPVKPVKKPSYSSRPTSTAAKISANTGGSQGNSYLCSAIKSKLNSIKSQLRSGNTNGNGEQLRDQRNGLYKQLADNCRR
jgi:hypothetical protein